MTQSTGPDPRGNPDGNPGGEPEAPRRRRPQPKIVARFVAISWRDLALTFGPILLVCAAAIYLAIRLIQPAPPNTLTLAAGPKGSSFWNAAQKYKTILARNRVTLNVLETQGSLDNLTRLEDPHSKVDVGFVQGGLTKPGETPDNLESLGSVSYVPLVVFYRSPTVVNRLSELKGKRLAIGAEGSGSRVLALTLLKANGIEPGGDTELLPLAGDEAAQALEAGRVDAVFLAGDSAQPRTMIKLMRTPAIRFMDFAQADAYTRRFPYLTGIQLPMGAFDFARNLPPRPVHMIAPTAELVARDSLHPALSDLLIEAAREVHGRANLLQRANEFPAPLVHEFRISDNAERYYKSGKSFLYRSLPFWVASLADRAVWLLVPLIVVLIPGLRLVPGLYRWRVKSRIYRWYGALIAIEREAINGPDLAQRDALLDRIDAIETAVNRMKMPLAFADQFYVLREHIGFVRQRLANAPAAPATGAGGATDGSAEGDATQTDAPAIATQADTGPRST
ncbi:TAXI family TRAP transporter solute-binding subunit [Caballeronia sp. LZ034LL]|uniref:TAXI family TRAP transporter solute-binding subunit n=1 Tax=Caballeronia sp. LZ034LL TaxID=3038567 RepID=UPI0028546604|nr:TAXI family TRAP transporter solute-binding subunit [Caballeronia sp. LZ034LL]MDR5834704.1 TAXI family TRAP transporter solute-binding subunit [Caballeronia sp. LZ034LL]